MISVTEARQMIASTVEPLSPITTSLADASDCTLAEDIYALHDIPAYRQSSMDGYAFAYKDVRKQLSVTGESAAGNRKEVKLQGESAMRIFTGAAVPEGADTVVMQEKIKLTDGKLTIDDDTLILGTNVRAAGSEIRKGELALKKDTYLSAAAIGFLAGIGVTKVVVHPKPRVTVILTGNELKQPGAPLNYGEVYESNSFAITAALKQFGIAEPVMKYAKDDVDELASVIKEALDSSDLILLTGGVSVGEYDFVIKAAEQLSVKTIFHRIKQRPGKPLFFGTHQNKVVFGLPGNPSSVLTCFYEYVVPAIGSLKHQTLALPRLHVPVSQGFAKKIKFTQFLKGYYNGTTVDVLASQESYKMNSFAKANCLVVMPEDVEELKQGDIAEIHLFAPHVS
jgi:molybdopterin molybdotransferase